MGEERKRGEKKVDRRREIEGYKVLGLGGRRRRRKRREEEGRGEGEVKVWVELCQVVERVDFL